MQHASLLTDHDIYLFKEGNHFRLYDKLGAHLIKHEATNGVYFSVFAPNAQKVSVIGDFNRWDKNAHPLNPRWDNSGIWEVFVPEVKKGDLYKFHVRSRYNNYEIDKRDPFEFFSEVPPQTASVVWDLHYQWNDSAWMRARKKHNALNAPFSIYEMHFGSWRRDPKEPRRFLSYRETADTLVQYLADMGYTHVEFLPLMAHPFYGSWGYQTIGYFAATSRYGNPQDLMYLIDCLHQNNIGVIFDWVPSHFPSDGYGLAYFDGTHLFEHSDPRKGFHPEWKTYIFNYGRHETREYLISSALFWLDKYHVDGIRVDGVASMLYLDYSRNHGEWIPNAKGGRENLEAVEFLQRFNKEVYSNYPDVQTFAEESTAWPKVSRPTYVGGLGFGMKWNMGWMHDTLKYFSEDPLHRKYHHNELTFSFLYVFHENFVLALSHDEVVHGKRALLEKMPGDDWKKFANLRLLFGYQFVHPGKKLTFMGQEFGQRAEWDHENSLDWHLLEYPLHKQFQVWVRDLLHVYKDEAALYDEDFSAEGFEWIMGGDANNSVIAFLRKTKDKKRFVLAVCNFTPVPRHGYVIGVPFAGVWKEILNSDAKEYGGSGLGNFGKLEAQPKPCHGRPYSITATLPPLAVVYFLGKPPKETQSAVKP